MFAMRQRKILSTISRYYSTATAKTKSSCDSNKNHPLHGIRVLDLTRIIAGPYCTMLLADLGAEVIKIERPHTGDESRKWGPPFLDNSVDSVYFMATNRNKKSVCIDFSSGADIITDLARKCDVLVENFIPGKLDEYGLSYEKLRSACPSLIYCSVTGFGSVGPYAKRPGYDVIASSYGGLLHVTGPENGAPAKVGVAIIDIASGLYAHGAIMAALLQRQRTGCGQKIDVNLLSTQLSCLINIGSNYLIAGKEAKRMGTAHESIVPYQTFETKDGYVCVGAGSDVQFKALCSYIGVPNVAIEPRYSDNKLRVENRKSLIETFGNVFRIKSTEEWMKILTNAPFPVGPVNTLQQAFDDPHVREIGIVKTLTHATAGDIRVVGPPVVYSRAENSARTAAPLLGENTDEVLREYLQFDDAKLCELRKQNIIS